MVTPLRTRLALVCSLAAAMVCLGVGTAFATGVWASPKQLDTAGAAGSASYLVACASEDLCLGASGATFGPVAYHLSAGATASSAFPFGLVNPFGSGDNSVSLTSLQCPSAAECVGVADYSNDEDDVDDVVASSTPAAGPSSWVEQNVTDPPTQLSCPIAALCVGAGQDGDVVTSSDPGGGTSAWTSTRLASAIDEVDCSSATFCVAYDVAGDVWTSTDPTGGASAWAQSGAAAPLKAATTASPFGDDDIEGTLVPENLSCTGPNLCIAVSGSGAVLVSTDPAGASAWTPVTVSSAVVSAVDCVAGSAVCLAGDAQGDIATSVDGSGASWTSVRTSATGAIADLSCAGEICAAAPVGESGGAPLFARQPASGGWRWNASAIVVHDGLSSVACPSAKECLGADQTRYFASGDPAQGVSSWRARVEDKQFGDTGGETLGLACYSATGCLAAVDDDGLADVAGGDLLRFDRAGGAHAFHDTGLLRDTTRFVACAQGTCVAGFPGDWLWSDHPAVDPGWRRVKNPLFDVTCLQGNASCVALLDGPFPGVAGPDLLVAAHRDGPWKAEAIDPGGQITGLACTSAKACVVVDAAGGLLVSTRPAAGVGAWKLSDSDPDGFNGVACENARVCVAVDGDGRVVVGRP